MTRKISIAIIVIIVAAGFLGFTSPGHRVLSSLGFATACTTGNC
jgi:hypothetical protein